LCLTWCVLLLQQVCSIQAGRKCATFRRAGRVQGAGCSRDQKQTMSIVYTEMYRAEPSISLKSEIRKASVYQYIRRCTLYILVWKRPNEFLYVDIPRYTELYRVKPYSYTSIYSDIPSNNELYRVIPYCYIPGISRDILLAKVYSAIYLVYFEAYFLPKLCKRRVYTGIYRFILV
jgi:hypothetical protein